MRGKPLTKPRCAKPTGITPADAGKTCVRSVALIKYTDHPRGCGENSCRSNSARFCRGSPPRMRGKLTALRYRSANRGITPADAGKTSLFAETFRIRQDHPRGCGENHCTFAGVVTRTGSPPRMRGKLGRFGRCGICMRITPADAGKTNQQFRQRNRIEDHPRGCGENISTDCVQIAMTGSPPRMRGKRLSASLPKLSAGITPADAGKTR